MRPTRDHRLWRPPKISSGTSRMRKYVGSLMLTSILGKWDFKFIWLANAKFYLTHLDRGRNIEPSINTEPESRMYQHVDSSPVLEK